MQSADCDVPLTTSVYFGSSAQSLVVQKDQEGKEGGRMYEREVLLCALRGPDDKGDETGYFGGVGDKVEGVIVGEVEVRILNESKALNCCCMIYHNRGSRLESGFCFM